MALTDTAIRNAKPRNSGPFRLHDAHGLYVRVFPTGAKYWRLDYRYGGKRKTLALGTYPSVTLAAARTKAGDARRLLDAGADPCAAKQANKRARAEGVANSFEAIANEWLTRTTPGWAEKHAEKIKQLFDRDIIPTLGHRPIADITAPEVLAMARRIAARGSLDTAHRSIGNCGQVFRYAVATGRAVADPTGALRGALPSRQRGQHFAAITDPKQLGELLRSIDGYQGTHVVRCALKLSPLVFVRPGELRTARWQDIDLDGAEWRYQVTKTDQPHIVPLSTQAVEILRDLHALTGRGALAFPGARSRNRPMSENAITVALRNLDIKKNEMSAHGFRATARTLLDEVLGFRVDYIEHQLAHAVRDPLGRAYNRTAHLPERRKMMQAWSDYLDRLRSGDSNVVELHDGTDVVELRGGAEIVELGAARCG